MIEQGFNYADSIQITDFFETRVENLEPTEEKKKKPTKKLSRKGKGKTPTPVL